MQRTLPAHPHDAPGIDGPEPRGSSSLLFNTKTPAEDWRQGLYMRRMAEYALDDKYYLWPWIFQHVATGFS